MLVVRLVVVALALVAAEKMQAPSSFMLVSGVSSPREMCLVGMGPAGALLDECTAALAELDGREVWSLTGSGSLTNLAAKKCLAAQPDAAAGSAVELKPGDEAGKSSTWELQANGQIKLGPATCASAKQGRRLAVHIWPLAPQLLLAPHWTLRTELPLLLMVSHHPIGYPSWTKQALCR